MNYEEMWRKLKIYCVKQFDRGNTMGSGRWNVKVSDTLQVSMANILEIMKKIEDNQVIEEKLNDKVNDILDWASRL